MTEGPTGMHHRSARRAWWWLVLAVLFASASGGCGGCRGTPPAVHPPSPPPADLTPATTPAHAPEPRWDEPLLAFTSENTAAWMRVDLRALRAAGHVDALLGPATGDDPLGDALRHADEAVWIIPDALFAGRFIAVRGAEVGSALRDAMREGRGPLASAAATGHNGTPVWRAPESGWSIHAAHDHVIIAGDYATVLRAATRPLPRARGYTPEIVAPVEADLRLSSLASSALARSVGPSTGEVVRSVVRAHAALRIDETWELAAGVQLRPGSRPETVETVIALLLAELVADRPVGDPLREAVESATLTMRPDEVALQLALPSASVDALIASLARPARAPGLPDAWLGAPPSRPPSAGTPHAGATSSAPPDAPTEP